MSIWWLTCFIVGHVWEYEGDVRICRWCDKIETLPRRAEA